MIIVTDEISTISSAVLAKGRGKSRGRQFLAVEKFSSKNAKYAAEPT